MNDLELAKKLISFKSITSNCEECLKTLKFIQNYLKEYNPQIHEFNGHYSLFAKNCTDNNFDIVFNGHIDVVPCDEEQFSAYEKNGFLYARGAIDMKSQVAVMINLFKSTTNKKMAIILTSDEEIGGHNGTCKILEKYNIKSKVAIVPDGGNDFELINSERGVLQLDITAKGKSVHSSIMNKGINAVSLAYQSFLDISSMLEKQNPNGQTVNLASITCPNQVYNKVPDIANMKLDIRYNNNCNTKLVFEYLDSKPYLEYKIYAEGNAFFVDINQEIIKKFINVAQTVLNREIKIIECPSASDARFFMKYNIPVIMINPNGKEMHGKQECLEISSLDKLKNIFIKFMEKI